jgi:DNA-binding transcriptional MerR regulator
VPTKTYSISDLADLGGVTPRTIRYYIAQGLLPSSGQPGPGAKYDDGHLGRLRLIRRLQREHLPLAEIRRRLADLDDDQVAALVSEGPAPAPSSALDYISSLLRPSVAETAAPTARPPMRSLLMKTVAAPPQPPSTDASPERSQWDRVALAPDIELHIRRPLDRRLNKRLERLIAIARELLEED